MLLSPLWSYLGAKNTVYVLTNTRAIILKKSFSTTVKSFGPDKLKNVIKNIRSDGSGDLFFDKEVTYDSEGDKKVKKIGFFGIERVNEVEDMLRELGG